MKKKISLPSKRSKRPTREELIKNEIWGENFVWWDKVKQDVFDEFRELLNKAIKEAEIQKYLELHPQLLVQVVGGGHGRWVIPQKQLGAEFSTDFIVGERHSFGYEWLLVELENPKKKMFNKNGDPSAALNHAIRQIQDWRAWLRRNQDYATRKKTEKGLELNDIDLNTPGLILIGREYMHSISDNDLRRQMCSNLNIKIHSYDWLFRVGSGIDVLTLLELDRK